jgi:glycosidase
LSFKNIEWPKSPKIFEINTWPWLHHLSEIYNLPITLKSIPKEFFNKEVRFFDVVWLMGVWERSPAARRIALEREDLQIEYHKALHDFGEVDVVGSPYSVYYYHVDSHLGGIEGLKQIRQQLAEKGIRLILDYVANHVAIDHMWILEKSDIFITGTLTDLMQKPFEFFSEGQTVYAHGKDPNFPSWTDTIQINAFSKEARTRAIKTLLNIAELCDGVRCDMAMLVTSKIFSKTWGEKAGNLPEKEFWEEIISAVKKKYPNFLFIAEVYWDMEWELLQQGFDYCYDKKLYDRLAYENAQKIREHLKADLGYQMKLVRFIENHDEERAVVKYGEDKSQAAGLITLTLPGAKLVYEGQIRGFKLRVPLQLGRRTEEKENNKIFEFYNKLLKIIQGKEFINSNWSLCNVEPVNTEDYSSDNIISYLWWKDNTYRLIVVNYSSTPSKAHIKTSQLNYNLNKWSFTDLLNQKDYTYNGKDLNEFGLYIDLDPWKGHIFDIKKV